MNNESQSAAESEIRALRAQSNEAIARHDAAAAVTMMREGVKIITSFGTFVDGASAMADVFKRIFSDETFVTFVRETKALHLGDGISAEDGLWTGTWKHRIVRGLYLARWQRQDGTWRIEGEFFVPLSGL